jgi:protein transport protein SEC61 subunit gamma and related proteins
MNKQGKGGNNRKKEEATIVQNMGEFVRDSRIFFEKCKKPDKAEYMQIMYACFMGFIVMGFIGYAVKLVFIPINNIILSN